MDFRSIAALDTDLEKDGKWFDWLSGVRVKVASGARPEYQREVRALLKPYENQIRGNEITYRERLLILAPAICKHLLRDWDGVFEGEQKVPFTKEKALAYLKDEAFHPFREFVLACAGDQQEYLAKQAEESEGN